MMLSDVCLSCTSGLSREQRGLVRPKLAEVAHVTSDSDTTFKVKRIKVKVTRPLYSPRRLHFRQLQRWAWESIHRGNLLLRCRLAGAAVGSAARGASAPTEDGEGWGHIVAAARLQPVSSKWRKTRITASAFSCCIGQTTKLMNWVVIRWQHEVATLSFPSDLRGLSSNVLLTNVKCSVCFGLDTGPCG